MTQFIFENLEGTLLLLSVPAILLIPISAGRLFIHPSNWDSLRVIRWMVGGICMFVFFIIVISIEPLQPFVFWSLWWAYMSLPIIGILGNAILAGIITRAQFSMVDKRTWIFLHSLAAITIIGACLKLGTLLLPVL